MEVAGHLLTVDFFPHTNEWNWAVSTKQTSSTPYIKEKVWTSVLTGTAKTLEDGKSACLLGFYVLPCKKRQRWFGDAPRTWCDTHEQMYRTCIKRKTMRKEG